MKARIHFPWGPIRTDRRREDRTSKEAVFGSNFIARSPEVALNEEGKRKISQVSVTLLTCSLEVSELRLQDGSNCARAAWPVVVKITAPPKFCCILAVSVPLGLCPGFLTCKLMMMIASPSRMSRWLNELSYVRRFLHWIHGKGWVNVAIIIRRPALCSLSLPNNPVKAATALPIYEMRKRAWRRQVPDPEAPVLFTPHHPYNMADCLANYPQYVLVSWGRTDVLGVLKTQQICLERPPHWLVCPPVQQKFCLTWMETLPWAKPWNRHQGCKGAGDLVPAPGELPGDGETVVENGLPAFQ